MEIKITKENERKILELRERIEKAADDIYKVNRDNIQWLNEEYFEKLKEELEKEGKEMSKIALEIIKKYNIEIYGPFYYCGFGDIVKDILTSKTVEEFIKNLQDYANWIEDWRDEEFDIFDENEGIAEIDISDAEYIVKVYRIAPCWCDGYLEAIVKCKSEEEAGKVADKIYNEWGDFGIAGANVNVEIVKVDEETEKEIKEEMREDITRLGLNHHYIKCCKVYSADDILT